MTDPILPENTIAQDIRYGLELGVKYVNRVEPKVEFVSMDYNQLATLDNQKVSSIDWIMLGPDSKQLSKFNYLNQIRQKRGLDPLKGFVLWQSVEGYSGISASQLVQEVSRLSSQPEQILFSNVFRLWLAHVNVTSHQSNNKTMDFAEFLISWCQTKACESLMIYPHEQHKLLDAFNQSSPENQAMLSGLAINWILVNATLKQAMQFTFVQDLSIFGFYHYQKTQSRKANDWLIEKHLKSREWAPNQYVALGFQSILTMTKTLDAEQVVDIKNNQVQWRNYSVQFQQGWPVLFEVSMD